MVLPCINCIFCTSKRGLRHHCFITKESISNSKLFDGEPCLDAAQLDYTKLNCLNCNDTGYSGGQPCVCRD